MKSETKKKASNASSGKTLLAPKHNGTDESSVDTLKGIIHSCYRIAMDFCIVFVKGLSVSLLNLLLEAKSLVSFMRYVNNAETRAKTYS